MSNIRDRRKHQNRVEAIAEALDLNHETTSNVPQALVSAEVSSSDNPTDLRSLPDDHGHTQAKDDSTNQHLDLYRGATGENLCSECNEIQKIFDFEAGIPVRSWRTLDLLAEIDRPRNGRPFVVPSKVWKVTHEISKTCSFCSFLMACASRMAIHTAVDFKSDDWFLEFGVRDLKFVTGNCARDETYKNRSHTQILELKLCQIRDEKGPFWHWTKPLQPWKDDHVIIPVQNLDDGHETVSGSVDWEVIIEWLHTCQSHHDYNCHTDLTTTTFENIPSFCLIDCNTQRIVPASQIKNLNYVTLSYVWGGPLTTQVTDPSTSLPVLPKSNERPRVVNDAMTVVQTIGYRYLWVDRYCIPQSDHDAKRIQIQNMGKIYSVSALTIIAAAGEDAEHGLPGVGSSSRLEPIWTTIRGGSRAMPVIYFEPPHNDILYSTWNSRGWTYQEALLSKRRLVFTDRHVYFQCESMQSVGYPADDNPNHKSEVFPFRKRYSRHGSWTRAVWNAINDYMKRILSYEEDTVHAAQGILESFRDIYDVWFFYGLPVMSPSASDMDSFHNDSAMPDALSRAFGTFRAVDSGTQKILYGLFWSDCWAKAGDNTHLGLEVIKLYSDRSEVRRTEFPSWTWAGWRIVRGWNLSVDPLNETALYIPDQCSFSVRLSYDDKDLSWPRDLGNIQHRSEITTSSQFPNFLVMTGPVFDVTITWADEKHQNSSSNWGYSSPPFLAELQSGGNWHDYKGPPFSPEEVGGRTIHLVALTLCCNVMTRNFDFLTLMLRPVGEDAHGQLYERVTCAHFSWWSFQPYPRYLSLADLNLRQMELRIR